MSSAVREAMAALRATLWVLLCATLTQGALATTPPSTGAAAVPSATLVIRKCCAMDQILNDNMRACVPLENATRQSLNITSFQEQKFWWMDANVRVAPSRKIENLSALALNATVRYKERPCEPNITSILWTTEASLYLNGSLEMQLNRAAGGPTEKFVLPPEDYCMDKTSLAGKLNLVFLACPCKHVVCIRKCCDNKRMLTMSEAIAMKQEAHCDAKLSQNFMWKAPFTTLTSGSERTQGNVTYARLRGPFPKTCPSGRTNVMVEMSDKLKNKLFSNGTLVADVTGSPFSVRQFCIDYGKNISKAGYFAYVCAQKREKKPMTWKNYLYVVLYLVGLASLLATLAVYALLPELRRPVYAKALMCHAAALAAALLTLAVGECISVSTYAECASLAFFGQFFLLASFFWLTVLCFDFTRGFMDLLPINDARYAGRRLLYYSLFAWSGPTIIVAITIAFNYSPGLPVWLQKPEIGLYSCWFSPKRAQFFYHYGPMACLLLANVLMFSYTMFRLRAAQRSGRGVLKNEDSCLTGGALRNRRERMLIYAKLFTLMGVTWLLEVVVWAVRADDITMTLVDAVNVLRGLGVFATCCCKRNVLNALRDRLPCLGKRHLDHSPSSYTHSTDVSLRNFSMSDGTQLRRIADSDDNVRRDDRRKSVK